MKFSNRSVPNVFCVFPPAWARLAASSQILGTKFSIWSVPNVILVSLHQEHVWLRCCQHSAWSSKAGVYLVLYVSCYYQIAYRGPILSLFSEPGRMSGTLCHSPTVRVRMWCVDKNFNLGHNFLTWSDRAFILRMCIFCDKTFHIMPKFLTL